jgi:phosphoglycerate dehydrogenase-like enzyme
MIEGSRNLRAVIVPWTGIPSETRDLLLQFPQIAMHNLHHNAAPVAEMTITLLLAAAKRVIPLDAALRRGDWSPRYEEPEEVPLLNARTVLILGYGEIGRRVARVLHAMDMTVLVVKRQVTATDDAFAAEIHPPTMLPELLPRAQALIVTLPLTLETADLLGEKELALIPPGCVLVNIGRGPVINQEALYRALSSGAIGAAGLDVW